jgi:CubicO group peptidase (beta-lactamase class C family)
MSLPDILPQGMKTPNLLRTLCASVLLLLPIAALGYPAPPPDPSLPPSEVPPAVQQLRRAMLDPEINSLTFRSMDRLFTTRTVPRAGAVWALPRADHALEFTYTFKGNTYSSQQFLERTHTNALLVMKDGRIVFETYRNGTDAATRFIGWSMTKSIVSILVGCALADGRIRSLDDPIERYLSELKGAPSSLPPPLRGNRDKCG